MPDIEKDTIVIIGASYVQHWPVRKLGGMQVVNRGVNGEQSFEMRRRFTEDVLAVKPRAVIIWGFINDIHRNTSENIDTVKARAKESTAEMVQLARASGIKPIIATEVTIRSKDSLKEKVAGWVGEILGKSSYQAYVNGHVLGVNRWIRDYAQANGILILDFEQLLADEMSFRKKEFATKDGTHISAAGYDELTAYTEKVVGVSTFQN